MQKIRDIFGADAILYLSVNEYGSSYQVFNSITKVDLNGKLVDLRTGKTLWEGTGNARSERANRNDSPLVALISSAVGQIIDTVNDKGYEIAAQAASDLVYRGENSGLLDGPRLPQTPKQQKK